MNNEDLNAKYQVGTIWKNRQGHRCEIVAKFGEYLCVVAQACQMWDNKLNLAKTVHSRDGRCLGEGGGWDLIEPAEAFVGPNGETKSSNMLIGKGTKL